MSGSDIEEELDDYGDEEFEEGARSTHQGPAQRKDSNAPASSGPVWLEAERHEKEPAQAAASPSPARSDANSDLMLVTSPSPPRESPQLAGASSGEEQKKTTDDANPATHSSLAPLTHPQGATDGVPSEHSSSKPGSSASQTTASKYTSTTVSRRSSNHSAAATQSMKRRTSRGSEHNQEQSKESTPAQTFTLTAVAAEPAPKKEEPFGGPVLSLKPKESSGSRNANHGRASATPQKEEAEDKRVSHRSPNIQDPGQGNAQQQSEGPLPGAEERKSLPKIVPRMNRTASTHARMTSKELIEEARKKKESEERREAALHEAELEKRRQFVRAEKLRFQKVLEEEKKKLKERLLAFSHSFPDSDLDEDTLLMEAVTPDPSPARDHLHHHHPAGPSSGHSKTPQPTSSIPYLPPIGKKPVRSSYTALQVVDPAIADFIFGGKVRVAKVPHHFIAQQRAKVGAKPKAAFKF
jgi:hypothetical protein